MARKFNPMLLAGSTEVGDTFRALRANGREIALGATLWNRLSDPDHPYEEIGYYQEDVDTEGETQHMLYVPDKGIPMNDRCMVAIVNATLEIKERYVGETNGD